MMNVKAAFAIVVMLGMTALTGQTLRGAGPADSASSYDPVIRCYNIGSSNPPLQAAATAEGLRLEQANAATAMGSPAIVLWEARQNAEPSDAQINELSEYLRKGGRLILTLSASPGVGAFRLRSLSPTTAWRTLIGASSRGGAFPATGAEEFDPAMFPKTAQPTLHVPFYFPLRPFDVAERGMQRYEYLSRQGLPGEGPVSAGEPSFTRPLLDRDWQIRIRADDVGESGLLLTGEYGGGRVAVFASSASAGAPVWGPLIHWLNADRPSQPVNTDSKPSIVISSARPDAQHHALSVELANNGNQAAHVEVIARVMTWEHAMIGDVIRPIDIAAGAKATVSLDLPQADAKQFQAMDVKDAFIIRLGLIANQGSTLIAEQSVPVDFRSPARVSVALDNLRQLPNPFEDVPGVSGQDRSTPSRMGEPVTAYAYPPGKDVNLTATVSNADDDLAPLARIADEIQPDNPRIVALNDQVQPANRTPLDGIQAHGAWMGKADADNTLLFTFPTPVHVNELVITGNPPEARDGIHNPSEVIVEANGKPVVDVKDFETQLVAQSCAVHVHFDLVETSAIRVRMPWSATAADGRKRSAPWIGEIEIHGYSAESPAVSGKLTLTLSDAATGTHQVLTTQDVHLRAGDENQIQLKIPAAAITTDAADARFFRVDAQLLADDAAATSSTTFMTIQPVDPLRPIQDIHPTDGPMLNFVVTRGFRNAFQIGTGTRESGGSWETPDDLIWTYERQLEQTGPGHRSSAKNFFVSESNFAHYCAPWSIFPDGEVFFDIAAPRFVEREEKQENWKKSDIAQLGFGDRWDTGPAASLLYSWQELAAFDEFLQSQKLGPLTGRTRGELAQEVQLKYENRYSAWHMARYAQCVKAMSDAFAAVKKKLILSGQGTPLVPDQYQQAISATIQGMSDDTTWGMSQENVPFTTGRQMATLAFNPVWKMNEVLVWGYDSAVLNNPHWHAAVGCTESSRRHYADPGWRGFVDPQGKYRLTCSYGFGMNANTSWCMSLNDYQEAFRMQQRLSLITPDAPLGVGLVIGNSSWNDPAHATFSGGGMGGSPADSITDGVASAFATLCDLRIPVAFSTNVAAMANWKSDTPIVILNLPELSDVEVKVLQALHDRGVRMIGFADGPISPAAAQIFGVTTDGGGAEAKEIGTVAGKPALATDTTMLIQAQYGNVTPDDLRGIAKTLRDTLSPGLEFPPGTAGYGFIRGKQKYIVVEDWREEGRDIVLRLRASPGASAATAINVNEHLPVSIKRDGGDWAIDFQTRPGDGTLVCVEEK